jgi:hypothetical protein
VTESRPRWAGSAITAHEVRHVKALGGRWRRMGAHGIGRLQAEEAEETGE